MAWLVNDRPDIRTDYALNEGGGERLELADGRDRRHRQHRREGDAGHAGHRAGRGRATPRRPTSGANAVPRLATLITRLADHRTRAAPAARDAGRCWRRWSATSATTSTARSSARRRCTPRSPSCCRRCSAPRSRPRGCAARRARNVMPGRASVECDCRVLPGTTEDDLRAELAAALGTDLPYELEFLEPPTGGTISPIDTPLFEICRRFVEEQRPGRDPAADDLHRLHRLALHARDVRHRRLRLLAGAAHADRGHARRGAQPRRAAAARTTWATRRGSRSTPAGRSARSGKLRRQPRKAWSSESRTGAERSPSVSVPVTRIVTRISSR